MFKNSRLYQEELLNLPFLKILNSHRRSVDSLFTTAQTPKNDYFEN